MPRARADRVGSRALHELLRTRDVRQLDIAREAAVSEPTVSRILSGTYPLRSVRSERTARRVLALVSAKTGIPVEELEALRQDATAAA